MKKYILTVLVQQHTQKEIQSAQLMPLLLYTNDVSFSRWVFNNKNHKVEAAVRKRPFASNISQANGEREEGGQSSNPSERILVSTSQPCGS